jgi:hypothetical protein
MKLKKPHRIIAKAMYDKFEASPTIIRDELVVDGIIKLINKVFIPNSNKFNYFYEITGKKLELPKKKVAVNPLFWPDGTAKSRGNAFDLSTAVGLFNKSEIANSVNRGKPNNYNAQLQVIAYSKA